MSSLLSRSCDRQIRSEAFCNTYVHNFVSSFRETQCYVAALYFSCTNKPTRVAELMGNVLVSRHTLRETSASGVTWMRTFVCDRSFVCATQESVESGIWLPIAMELSIYFVHAPGLLQSAASRRAVTMEVNESVFRMNVFASLLAQNRSCQSESKPSYRLYVLVHLILLCKSPSNVAVL